MASSKWSSPLFGFMRQVKAHPELRDAKESAAFNLIDDVIQTWRVPVGDRRRRDPGCHWWHWFGISSDGAEAEFIGAWDKIRHVPGDDPLASVWAAAQRTNTVLPDSITQPRPGGYKKFIAFAALLQSEMGERNILLPVERLARLMGLEPVTISRYRRWGVEDRFLLEISPAVRGSRATEFQFVDWRDLALACPDNPSKAFADLVEAITAVCEVDASQGRIGKVAKHLLLADPPFTPAEVRALPAIIAEMMPGVLPANGGSFVVTPEAVQKHIGWTRKKPQKAGRHGEHGSGHRQPTPEGKYAGLGTVIETASIREDDSCPF